MGIFKKITDVLRSNLNELINHMEDPKKMSDLAILELGEQKNKAKSMLIKAMAQTKLLKAHVENLRKEASALSDEALSFLRQGQESKAEEILREKQGILQEAQTYENELNKELIAIETFNRGLSALDSRISQEKSAGSIKASAHYLEKEDAFDTFSRMEEKIEHQEAELLALQELMALTEAKENQPTRPNSHFDRHSNPDDILDELNALKKKL